MTKRYLLEAATLASESASEDGTWRVQVIAEGRGSSGVYTAELLENHHHAFDNVLSFRNHPTGWDGPQDRDFTMIAGEVVGETWAERNADGRMAVFANWRPDPEYKDKIARYKDKLGLSIYVEGSGFENESGDFVVDWFNPEDPYASLDVVIAPGARGKFMESARRAYENFRNRAEEDGSATADRQTENLEVPMELKDIVDGVSTAIKEALAPLVADVAAIQESLKPAEAPEVDLAATVEAVAEAGLPKASRTAVIEAFKAGKSVEDAVKDEKARVDAIRAELAESIKAEGFASGDGSDRAGWATGLKAVR